MSDGRPGLLLVHDSEGLGAWQRDLEQRLVALGFEVASPEVLEGESFPPDRQVQAALETALTELGDREGVDAERLGVLGFGVGGTHAFLLGCASTELEVVAIFDSPIVYPELSRERPIQPLEMALNLSAPLLAIYASSPPSASSEEVERLRQVGSQFAKDFDIVSAESGPALAYRQLSSSGASGDDTASLNWAHLLTFLADHLELPELEPRTSSSGSS